MEHHHHHHHSAPSQSLNGIFILSIILNSLFVLIEAGVGLWQNSLSLLSDAGHNLSDVFSLLLVLIAFRLAKVRNKDFAPASFLENHKNCNFASRMK